MVAHGSFSVVNPWSARMSPAGPGGTLMVSQTTQTKPRRAHMYPMHPYLARNLVATRTQEMINNACARRIAVEARHPRHAKREAGRYARHSARVVTEPAS